MGVAGVAIVWMIYCFFKSIVSVITFFVWKSKINTIGIVKELKSVNDNYQNDNKKKISSIDYTWSISIDEGGNTYLVDYVERVSGDKPSETVLNSSFAVFVDKDKKVARSVKEMKNQIWQWPLAFLFSTAILIICFIIVSALDS